MAGNNLSKYSVLYFLCPILKLREQVRKSFNGIYAEIEIIIGLSILKLYTGFKIKNVIVNDTKVMTIIKESKLAEIVFMSKSF